jgi:hypothetical protein
MAVHREYSKGQHIENMITICWHNTNVFVNNSIFNQDNTTLQVLNPVLLNIIITVKPTF